MNAYPSWIQRIPELLEILGLLDTERLDRQLIEHLFDLRKTAAADLLRRMGAERVGNSMMISRGRLMARLREASEHPDWKWEVDRRLRAARQIGQLRRDRQGRAKVLVSQLERQLLDQQSIAGLPPSVNLGPGALSIACRSMDDLMQQLLMVIKAIDNDYDAVQKIVEHPVRKKPSAESLLRNDRKIQLSGGLL
jgi:hypothetical protein